MMTQIEAERQAEAEPFSGRTIPAAGRPTLARKALNVLTAALVLTVVAVAVVIYVLTRPR